MTLKGIYKCRICGATFETCVAGERVALKQAYMFAAGLSTNEPQAPAAMWVHNCVGKHFGSIGIADFQGWIKEDD